MLQYSKTKLQKFEQIYNIPTIGIQFSVMFPNVYALNTKYHILYCDTCVLFNAIRASSQ